MAQDFGSVATISNDDGTETEIFRRKRKFIPPIRRSLGIMVASLQGQGIVVELKNDVEVYGSVDETDAAMNLTLSAVREMHPNGTVIESDVLHLNGNSIRYIHLPPNINPGSHVTNYLKTLDRLTKQSRPHTIKDKPIKRAKGDDSSSTIEYGTETITAFRRT